MDAIIEAFGAFIPVIKTKLDIIIYSSLPFNLVKGVLNSTVTFMLYKRLRKGGFHNEQKTASTIS